MSPESISSCWGEWSANVGGPIGAPQSKAQLKKREVGKEVVSTNKIQQFQARCTSLTSSHLLLLHILHCHNSLAVDLGRHSLGEDHMYHLAYTR